MAALQFMKRDEYFDVLKKQLFDNLAFDAIYGGWKADVFQPENYEFDIYVGGKLFNFYHLKNNQASPTNWTKDKTRQWFSPTLTLINGEVKVGAF